MLTSLKFVNVGFHNGVCANRVLAIINPNTAPARRQLTQAKKTGNYQDTTCGRGLGSMLLLDDGRVVGSYVQPRSMLGRFNSLCSNDDKSIMNMEVDSSETDMTGKIEISEDDGEDDDE